MKKLNITVSNWATIQGSRVKKEKEGLLPEAKMYLFGMHAAENICIFCVILSPSYWTKDTSNGHVLNMSMHAMLVFSLNGREEQIKEYIKGKLCFQFGLWSACVTVFICPEM